jgi:DNA-binding NarL/FixJ family response regulator
MSTLLESDYQEINQKLLKLTIREWDVLALIAEGLSTSEIAETLFVEPKSIENYRARISSKLKLSGRSSLLKFSLINKEHLIKFYKLIQD